MSNIEEFNELNALYDIYGSLLTKKQCEYFELYYFEDFSLAEIALEAKVSRNAIHSNLQLSIKHLYNYEKKLGYLEKRNKIINLLEVNMIDKEIKNKIMELL